MHNEHLPEREESMEEERVSLFTVTDIGRSLSNFAWLTLIYVVSVVLYELDAGWRGFPATAWRMFVHSPQFLASATILIIAKEGGDIVLFHRWAAARRRHAQDIAEAKAEAHSEGHSEGFAEGRSEVFEVQQQWTAWNERRLRAEASGEPFNEPPPQPPQ